MLAKTNGALLPLPDAGAMSPACSNMSLSTPLWTTTILCGPAPNSTREFFTAVLTAIIFSQNRFRSRQNSRDLFISRACTTRLFPTIRAVTMEIGAAQKLLACIMSGFDRKAAVVSCRIALSQYGSDSGDRRDRRGAAGSLAQTMPIDCSVSDSGLSCGQATVISNRLRRCLANSSKLVSAPAIRPCRLTKSIRFILLLIQMRLLGRTCALPLYV